MITVHGRCAGGKVGGGGIRERGEECSFNGGDEERLLSKSSPNVS